ncbi:thioredoxin reductase 1, cytoplasmic [Chanos chanos]|uniref:Thioredoxin reductase 1, cytoplasmic n=1 Tax=Chanos chanos TaxID=29144 RepID=A0A6J2UTD2_CHACN|nr:thioredoxin reductase 1, cytoplasmic [Chanos chanos]
MLCFGALTGFEARKRDLTHQLASSMEQTEALGCYDYDLLVIGGGSAGLAVAKEAASLGKMVLVLDYGSPSPAGRKWGSVASKLLHQAALLGNALRDAPHYGWRPLENVSHSWSEVVSAVQQFRRAQSFECRQELRKSNITFIQARARFLGSHTVEATNSQGEKTVHTAAVIVIATGDRQQYPGIPGDREYCITCDDLLAVPDSVGCTLVVGGSAEGLECAGFLSGLGLDVTVMVQSVLLEGFDRKVTKKIENHMYVHGVNFLHHYIPIQIEQVEEGKLRVMAVSTEGTETYEGEFNTVLLSLGREACTKDLGLENVGVNYNKRTGKISVNGNDQTNVPNIYAIGSSQENPLTHPTTRTNSGLSVLAGRMLAQRLYGERSIKCDYSFSPAVVFTPMEYACCGLSEERACESFGEENIEVYHSPFWPLEWTLPARNKNSCYAKVICHIPDNRRVVGLHVLGPSAGEIIQGFAAALRCGLTKDQLDTTVAVHSVCAQVLTNLTVTQRESDAMQVRGNC